MIDYREERLRLEDREERSRKEERSRRKMMAEEAQVMVALARLMDEGIGARTILEVLCKLSPPTKEEKEMRDKTLPGSKEYFNTGFVYPCGPDMVISRSYGSGQVIMLAWAMIPMADTVENRIAIDKARDPEKWYRYEMGDIENGPDIRTPQA